MTFLSIVVPVLDEGATLATRLQALAPLRARGAEGARHQACNVIKQWICAGHAATPSPG